MSNKTAMTDSYGWYRAKTTETHRSSTANRLADEHATKPRTRSRPSSSTCGLITTPSSRIRWSRTCTRHSFVAALPSSKSRRTSRSRRFRPTLKLPEHRRWSRSRRSRSALASSIPPIELFDDERFATLSVAIAVARESRARLRTSTPESSSSPSTIIRLWQPPRGATPAASGNSITSRVHAKAASRISEGAR